MKLKIIFDDCLELSPHPMIAVDGLASVGYMQDARFEQRLSPDKGFCMADRRKIGGLDIQLLQGAATIQPIFGQVGCRFT